MRIIAVWRLDDTCHSCFPLPCDRSILGRVWPLFTPFMLTANINLFSHLSCWLWNVDSHGSYTDHLLISGSHSGVRALSLFTQQVGHYSWNLIPYVRLLVSTFPVLHDFLCRWEDNQFHFVNECRYKCGCISGIRMLILTLYHFIRKM